MSCTPRLSVPCVSAILDYHGAKFTTDAKANTNTLGLDSTKERIRKMFDKVELSISPYDTAWMAMVPSPNCQEAPFFPQCAKWILENQLNDGSWGLPLRNSLLVKDALSSTLACILALKKWGIGEEQINRGLQFIEFHSALATDEKQHNPIGFDIIFPSMIEYARDLNLNIPLRSINIDAMITRKNLELKRSIHGSTSRAREMYLAFVSEGIGKSQDWEMVMKYQRKNGSLFDSPSTTAAAFSHLQDSNCLHYLQSLLENFGDAVPTIYPMNLYARLCLVDTLIRLGIDRHFKKEIKVVLEQTYRCWLMGDEEIFLNCATCALAFRILRLNGYDVSSDVFNQFTEEQFHNSLDGYLMDTRAALELYHASQIIYPDEWILEKQNSWTSHFLKQELSNESIFADKLSKDIRVEVHDALSFPYLVDLKSIATKRNIEHYNAENTRILKTSYRWRLEYRLDKLKFARQNVDYCHFCAAAVILDPKLSNARILWAKSAVFTTVIDDFFDIGGSQEDLINFMELMERWDVEEKKNFCSEKVEIIYKALVSTIREIAEEALPIQGRDVASHVADIWMDFFRTAMVEAQWSRDKTVPTLEEYIENAYISFALGPIVLPALYFVGPKLPEEAVRSQEYDNLFEAMSIAARLLNDWRGFKREIKEGKLNAVTLQMIQGGGTVTEEDAIETIKHIIDYNRREVLRLVLQEKDSIVPRACKDLFWDMMRVLSLFYKESEGTYNDTLVSTASALVNERVSLDILR
ncbi:hypothetical protein Tsubulata_044002 [Turnera subulata]|uniref:ent-kaurene synthase n=1 Tax=Turnera subulata TaxID=218843 RepID=A0A9Q0F227_9ROSI|nr:hypothetical protein Tsubulata_044002 [Turnera subulata]